MSNKLTCEDCPKFRAEIRVCLHRADSTAPYHPVCDAGRIFIAEKDADETINAAHKKSRTSL